MPRHRARSQFRSRLQLVIIIAVITLAPVLWIFSSLAASSSRQKATSNAAPELNVHEKSPLSVTHIVLVQYKPGASASTIEKLSEEFLALQGRCLDPKSRKPYIKSVKGGADISIEGRHNGMSHAFVMEFATVEDRDYYTNKDPAHLAFSDRFKTALEELIVVDFQQGEFVLQE